MFAECAIQHMIFLIRHVTLGTDPLVLVSHLLLALFNTASRAAPLLLVLGNKFFLGERVEALQLLQKTKSIEQSTEWTKRNMLEKNHYPEHLWEEPCRHSPGLPPFPGASAGRLLGPSLPAGWGPGWWAPAGFCPAGPSPPTPASAWRCGKDWRPSRRSSARPHLWTQKSTEAAVKTWPGGEDQIDWAIRGVTSCANWTWHEHAGEAVPMSHPEDVLEGTEVQPPDWAVNPVSHVGLGDRSAPHVPVHLQEGTQTLGCNWCTVQHCFTHWLTHLASLKHTCLSRS